MNGYHHNTSKWVSARACADGACVEVTGHGHEVLVRNSQQPDYSVRFTLVEWEAFLQAAKDGDFDDLQGPAA